jgi:hypothetical protein
MRAGATGVARGFALLGTFNGHRGRSVADSEGELHIFFDEGLEISFKSEAVGCEL